MRINRYLPFALVYFFINALALPFGLTYTALLSPLLYWWVITQRKTEILLPFFVCFVPYFIVHLVLGVDVKTYLVSILNYTFVYIFCQAFYTFLKVADDKEKIYRILLIINFILCLIAVPIYFTSFNSIFWMSDAMTVGLESSLRLKLFTYEPSYYAMLFTPLFFFFFMQLLLGQNKIKSWLLLLMLLLPYILSFSIGTIGCILIACMTVYLFHFRKLTKKKTVLNIVMLGGIGLVVTLLILWLFIPDNSLFLRLENIFSGKDTSGKGRTSDAFYLAMRIMDLKSHVFGVGAGQIKVIGAEIIRNFYFYPMDYTDIAIPNAAAETLAIFGWLGLSLRLLIELFLFFYTKVWTNYFRFLLFIFIFVYQFTGSFVTNIAEYVIWILAFTNVFGEFDVKKAASYKL
ncbi:MAG: hypothetical protein QM737_08240 [Ferruginibacter sp.]